MVSLTDFLDGCARVGQESTTNEIRSTLEDLEVIEENHKTNGWTSSKDLEQEVPAKHGNIFKKTFSKLFRVFVYIFLNGGTN